MKPLFAFVCACAMLLGISANAQMLNRAVHNGSLMDVFANRPNVEIRYALPRPGLWDVGVQPGTLLLYGQWRGNVLFATAHVFAYGCPPFPYQVSGSARPDGVLILEGMAPLVDGFRCAIVGWGWTENSTLVFEPN